jgi:2-iminobutanoate/2-iminopropanoate deaminase
MEILTLQSADAPAAIGPYVQATEVHGFLFLSGQLGIDANTGVLPEAIVEQTQNSLANISSILKEAGLTKQNIVKTTIFLTDMNDFAAVNEIYATFFGSGFPARSCVAVKSLPKGAAVEIECIAAR